LTIGRSFLPEQRQEILKLQTSSAKNFLFGLRHGSLGVACGEAIARSGAD
jgi:hypothetical protein